MVLCPGYLTGSSQSRKPGHGFLQGLYQKMLKGWLRDKQLKFNAKRHKNRRRHKLAAGALCSIMGTSVPFLSPLPKNEERVVQKTHV
jgi:hypothetical protein